MEIEALKSRFTEALGSTKLQLSERTLDGMLQDALAEVGDDDSRVTDDFIARKVTLAKTIDGQINHDVSVRIEDWKKQNVSPKVEKEPTEKPDVDGMPKWFEEYKKEQEAKIAELEAARKADKIKADKEEILDGVKKGLQNKFAAAGVESNAFILKQTLRDISIPDEGADVKSLVKEMESQYYANLKEAGFEVDKPRGGGAGGNKGKSSVDDYWAKKKAKEGWGK